ncbi:MAG: helix-turn-helix domain-containing protein [Victivallaceae bacterium]|jgi:hypothetical protein
MAARRNSIKRIIIDNDNEREIKSESLYSIPKLCQILETDRKSVYRLIRIKKLAAVKFGHGWKVDGSSVISYIKKQYR